MDDKNNHISAVNSNPSGLCRRAGYRLQASCLYLRHFMSSLWRSVFCLKGFVPSGLRSPDIQPFVYYLLSLKSKLTAKNLLTKYLSKRPEVESVRMYEFFKSLKVSDLEIEVLLLTACAKALLNMNGSLRAFEMLKSYSTAMDKYLLPLRNVKQHNFFFELYVKACRQVGAHDECVNTCKHLIRLRPMDWKNYFNLAISASSSNDEEYLLQMKRAKVASTKMSPYAYTLLIDACIRCGEIDKAYEAFILGKATHQTYKDFFLSAAVIENSRSNHSEGFRWIQRYYKSLGLPLPYASANNSFDSCFQSLKFSLPKYSFPGNPKVSVIMTCYNSEKFLDTSIRSALNQTYGNIELIVVDDNSEDHSVEKIKQWESKDGRVRLMEKKINEGTYVSKNRAILETTGDFITFFDSDDWMHPMRIEQHLKHTPSSIAMSYSDWVRITENFIPAVRRTGGFTHMNSASTFVRKNIFERIGYFDSVRAGADSEFIWRIQNVYGKESTRRISLPLSLARLHENSLTTSGLTAFDENRISPVRLQYWDSWVKWHCQTKDCNKLTIPYPYRSRSFEAPSEISVPYTDI